MEEEKTVLGIGENIEGALCYVLGFVSGIVFLIMEKKNEYIRFHALQSVVVFLGLFILNFILGVIPIIGLLISLLLFPVGLVLWILLMFKAYKGEKFKLPYIGDFVEKQLSGEKDTKK